MSEYNQQGQNVNNQWNAGRDINIANLEIYAPCPICDRNNKIEKVSAILDRETHNINGVTSVLAMKLKAPAQPQAKGKPSWIWWLAFVPLGFYSYAGLTGAVISFWGAIKVAYAIGEDSPMVLRILPENRPGLILLNLEYGVGLSIGTLLLILCLVWVFRKYKKKKEAYQREIKRVQVQEYPKWEKAMERWKKLYYCYTDGCVFIPGEKTWAESDAINEYVYRTT